MNESGVKIEVHLIQNFAPSNLNRDDTGQPKSAYFGGFRRARISSQSSKRATRLWWREHNSANLGYRTKRLQQLIGERLAEDSAFVAMVPDERVRKEGIRLFTDAYYAASDTRKPDTTNVLIFISPDEVDACADAIKEIWDEPAGATGARGKSRSDSPTYYIAQALERVADLAERQGESGETDSAGEESELDEKASSRPGAAKKKMLGIRKDIAERIAKAHVSADIALFGRMLAEQPDRATDGACQVAHPISTHKVDMEMDYYTAVDDLNPAEETGAGMLGEIGFNSACYYRYALVDRDQLARNLARKTQRKNGKWSEELTDADYAEADKVIRAFLEAMVYAIPSGKQNSFGARNLPSFGLFIRLKDGVPVSLANAFAKPIRPTPDDDDLVGLSVAALGKHWQELERVYGNRGVQTAAYFQVGQESRLAGLPGDDKGSVAAAIDAVMAAGRTP